MRFRSWKGSAAAAAALVAGAALACGGGDEAVPPASPAAERAAEPEADRPNAAPVIEDVTLEPRHPIPGGPLQAVVQTSDPDGDRVRVRYAWRVNGEPVADTGGRITLRGMAKHDEIEVEVVASDGRAESEPVTEATRVANRPPVLWAVALEAGGELKPGRQLVATPRGDDPDGDLLTYSYRWLVNDEPLEAEEGPVLSTSKLHRGDRVEVVAIANDGEDASEPKTSPPVTLGNSPPEILSDAEWTQVAGVFRYRVEARDPDGDRSLRYRLLKAPEGMEIDPILGEVSWKPSAAQAGRHPVEIEVDDLRGGRALQRFDLTIDVQEPEAPAGEGQAAAPPSGGAQDAEALEDEAQAAAPGAADEEQPPAERAEED